ncbi:NAD(P)/FAD-dependent oxidoreductase [Nonomuraea africana]|uniref:NADPH-dependent 2,4-dienoyl-CoA reductase/sulfur reductase-like enzyme n=1 Tax=Nonomuraea africana TaxID=46171 RepID=A0ABR9KDS2_9ACTN|nr:FAD-dependent oxidoreductase [Nonomuraea africana]MBE1560169.1 NADPH-dependent 2,4-dienoyl-CoA reductase/sulfur reductase-like enzyme [Nonomuraea africana]
MNTVCVVGASLAGLLTARALRAQGYAGRLVLVGEERHRPYDRPPLSKDFLRGAVGEADLALEGEGEELGIEWRLGVAATGLDAVARRVTLSDGTSIRADGIVIATGAAARELPGSRELAGVHTLRTLDDARALRGDLESAKRMVVIGGGFIGAEVAATARDLGLDVTLVESGTAPLAGVLGHSMAEAIATLHERRGVRLMRGAYVTELTGTERVDGVRLADGTHLPADVVVVGIGAIPNTSWLEGSGLELGDGVVCDEGGGTSVPGVVAVGDCAAWFDPAQGDHHRIEHWTGARQRAAVAAATLLSGGTARPEPARPAYFWSDQFDIKIQFIGHARHADSVTVEEGDLADHSFLAVYRQGDRPVAVLGVNQVRLFTRWRRHLETAPVQAG